MARLNHKAYTILVRELERCVGNDPLNAPQKILVLKRLERLRQQTGDPVSAQQLQETIQDLIPEFSNKAIQQAAKANQPSSGIWGYLSWGVVGLAGCAGLVYILNLPYPMIRWPVAKTIPLVLLPSYMKMDYDYRGAIANVEKSDQLINQATSAADIELGAEKVALAQKHLDGLPVWFLGYYPQRYCTLFSCSWQFTLDEYQVARKQVARMEAKVFQENNALTLLQEGQSQIEAAKGQYQQANSESDKQEAISLWQTGLDKLAQIPPQTVAGRMSEPQIKAYERDFQNVSGRSAGTQKTDTLIQAAAQYGMAAAQMSQNPPHPEAQWQEIIRLWDQGSQQLERVTDDNPAYVEAQKKLAEYRKNAAMARIRLENEQNSMQALNQAKSQITTWQQLATSTTNKGVLVSGLQRIIYDLDRVKSGTTATEEARSLRQFAEAKMQELSQ
ncbi:hypothetical protein PMG71_10465 [Roseofilum sp. BLCC_M154]|uniref:Uncharacterized protein n=1 Tax=Roseofilum acuticapitatum BLCC-M154 TaxID=3022444 RepID=A0ABT7ATT6_9CYAN|nr:hypothetical protein [Roseofilum acuticapitatum]MDJ1169849.1 hypothetical protein [Roseofilum acuticapitatum BLCC-M154]